MRVLAMSRSVGPPTIFRAAIDYHFSIFFWILAVAAIAAFPPAILGVVFFIWWRYQWLGRKYQESRARAKQEEEASRRRFLKQLEANRAGAKRGDKDAQYDYGKSLLQYDLGEYGAEWQNDQSAGYEWISKAADQGHAKALRILGDAYLKGAGPFAADPDRAAEYYLRAHNAGEDGVLGLIQAIQDQISHDRAEEATRLRLGLSEAEWKSTCRFFEMCESPPERLLLEALIQEGRLRPVGDQLVGNISVQQQVERLTYRLDFLVNGWLAIEVDGRAFHGNREAFERDRLRDQEMLGEGITTMRFPARQVFENSGDAAQKIIGVATK